MTIDGGAREELAEAVQAVRVREDRCARLIRWSLAFMVVAALLSAVSLATTLIANRRTANLVSKVESAHNATHRGVNR